MLRKARPLASMSDRLTAWPWVLKSVRLLVSMSDNLNVGQLALVAWKLVLLELKTAKQLASRSEQLQVEQWASK